LQGTDVLAGKLVQGGTMRHRLRPVNRAGR
jgi:hypothetical protein